MSEFKKGDRVMVVRCIAHDKNHEGKIGDFIEGYKNDESKVLLDKMANGEHIECIATEIALVNPGFQVSNYDSIKSRIEAITGNTSIKEVDDILRDIGKDNLFTRNDNLKCFSVESKDGWRNIPYDTQCSELSAFKQALLWLLNNSEIKYKRLEEIFVLKKQMGEIQDKIANLEREAV
jgi:hypothetical protein